MIKFKEYISEAAKVVHPDLAAHGIDAEAVKKYVHMVNSELDGSGLETRGEKMKASRAKSSFFKHLDKIHGGDEKKVRMAHHKISTMYDDKGEKSLYEEAGDPCWKGYKQLGMKQKNGKKVPNCVPVEEQFDLIEEMVMDIAEENDVDPETIWESLDEVTDDLLYEYAIDAKGHKSSTGGLTQKGVDAYNRETGGNLKTAVTTPPSKLKPGSKAAKRRKSFCARMSGVDGPMKDEKGRPTRKALALRKWNC